MHSLSWGIFKLVAPPPPPNKCMKSQKYKIPYLKFQLSEIYKIYPQIYVSEDDKYDENS